MQGELSSISGVSTFGLQAEILQHHFFLSGSGLQRKKIFA
jgi:hypothetical protein